MKEHYCDKCGREMIPAPAMWDGEPTYVGYYPCRCDELIMTECGVVYPGSPEHTEIIDRGRKMQTKINEI